MFTDKIFSRTFLDVFTEFVERVRMLDWMGNLYPQTKERILQPVTEPQAQTVELKPIVSNVPVTLVDDNPEAWFIKLVEDCLRKYSDSIALAQSPLVEYVVVTSETHIERGKRLQRLLYDAIESLRPAGIRPREVLPRDWYNYVVLHDAYVLSLPNREIMSRLYVSEGTFHRTRRNAVRGLARMLLEVNTVPA